MVATHASVFTRVPNGSALTVDYHSDAHLLACIFWSAELQGRKIGGGVVPVVFLAPNRFPGPSLAPFEAFEALWVAWRMCVRSEGFASEIRGRAARGDEDFSKTVEANRNFETIRGRSMAIKVWGGRWDGYWGGSLGSFAVGRVTSYPPLTNVSNHQGRGWVRAYLSQWLSSTSFSSRSLLQFCSFS